MTIQTLNAWMLCEYQILSVIWVPTVGPPTVYGFKSPKNDRLFRNLKFWTKNSVFGPFHLILSNNPSCKRDNWIQHEIAVTICVVYFDQGAHACACIHMVENNKKCLKPLKKVLFSFRSIIIACFVFT